MLSRKRRTSWCALLCLALAIYTAISARSWPQSTLITDDIRLDWWSLSGLFALTTFSRLRAQRLTATLLSGSVLVVGLFCAEPTDLVVGVVVGSLAARLLLGRTELLRTALAVGINAAAVSTAVTVFLMIEPEQSASHSGWGAAAAAAAAFVATELILIILVIPLIDGLRAPNWRSLLSEAGIAVALLPGSITIAVAMRRDVWSGILGLVALSAGAVLLRSYGSLSERYLGLQRLYGYSRAVGSEPALDDVLRRSLLQAQELLQTQHSEIIFCRSGELAAIRVTVGADGLERELLEPLAVPTWAYIDSARLVRHGNWHHGMAVSPLRGENEIIGVLAVRHSDSEVTSDFTAREAHLLETFATHMASALLNGELLARLQHESLHDPLTGLPNRLLFEQLVNTRLETGEELAVMILDLDDFKDVNSTLGHHSGDLLLQEIGNRVALVNTDSIVAHLGADEFACAVVRSGVKGYEDWAAAINHAIVAPVHIDVAEFEISASTGIAVAPRHGTNAAELLKHAELACYAAKKSIGGVRTYTTAMDSHSPERLALIRDLRKALEMGQLLLHFQPQICLQTGRVLGCEALVRWQHPQRGLINPDEFIPSAERSGLIRPLTRVILSNAVATCAAWKASGLDIGVAVNVSARSLIDNDLVADVAAVLLRHNLAASRLTIEVTESSVMSDPERVRTTLDRLGTLGVTVSIDDFGTGQTSLAYLQDLPVQEVKIDKSFVMPMLVDPGRHAITKAIIELANTLGMRVVAEGVEDPRTLQTLKQLGCHCVQGFHISRPMAGSAVLSWVDEWNATEALNGPWDKHTFPAQTRHV